MKHIHLAAFTTLALAAALSGPVMAQSYGAPPPPPGAYDRGPGGPGGYGQRPGGWDLERRIQWTQDRISRARDEGSLHRRQFYRIQGELNGIRHDRDEAFRRNGGRMDPGSRDELQARLDRVNDQLRFTRDRDEHRPW